MATQGGTTVTRRGVLATAVFGGAAVAMLRLLGPGNRLLPVPGQAQGKDWTSPLGDESMAVAHLLRRAGFGATPAELEAARSAGFDRTLEAMLDSAPDVPEPLAGADAASRVNPLRVGQLQTWWLDHMQATRTPLAERMTLFWHGHFTSDYRKVGVQDPFIYWQNQTWRDMGLSDLRSMLLRVTTDPAMLRYLDLGQSTGQSPNENYSRELMELFTMGADTFTEDDVRAGARALAGWRTPRTQAHIDGQVQFAQAHGGTVPRNLVADPGRGGIFEPRRAYAGDVTFLGRTGHLDTEAVIDQILAQDATAAHIAGKVASAFVMPNPSADFVSRLAASFRKSRYSLKQLMHDALASPEFRSQSSYRGLVKSPIDFAVHAARAVGATKASPVIAGMSRSMGQELFDPPDVGGWPTDSAWISSSSMLARVNYVTALLVANHALPDATAAINDHLDGIVSPATAQLMQGAVDDQQRWFLCLASPEFQLK
ncbi:MAG: DUF1800 domain-containing protein [Candidatus Dormibacteria bacterium]